MCDIPNLKNITSHRKGQYHNILKRFVHPRCKHCKKDFKDRPSYDQHKFTEPHLR